MLLKQLSPATIRRMGDGGHNPLIRVDVARQVPEPEEGRLYLHGRHIQTQKRLRKEIHTENPEWIRDCKH